MISSRTAHLSPWQKKMRLARTFALGRPIWCAWQVTYRCNFRCTFCNYWKESAHREEELSLAEIEKGSANLATIGSLLVSIAGGEPFLRKDLPQVVEAISRYHFAFITTNGFLVTRRLARELYDAGLWGISISIDYADEKAHDAARGVRGAFRKAVQALEIFSEERTRPYQRVNLMAVLMNDNLEDMEGLIRLAEKVGANFMVQPYSDLKTGEKRFLPSQGSSRVLLELKRRYPHFLSNPEFLAKFDLAVSEGVPGCLAGKRFFNIDNVGRVAPCVENRFAPVGKVTDEPFGPVMKRLRSSAPEDCRGCWYNCRGEIESLLRLKGLLSMLPLWLSDSSKRPRKRPASLESSSG